MTATSFGLVTPNGKSVLLKRWDILSHQIKALNDVMLGLYFPMNLIRY
jgi:hypothetical protein